MQEIQAPEKQSSKTLGYHWNYINLSTAKITSRQNNWYGKGNKKKREYQFFRKDLSYRRVFLGYSDIGDNNDLPKFRTLTKCHTEKWSVRRVIKTKRNFIYYRPSFLYHRLIPHNKNLGIQSLGVITIRLSIGLWRNVTQRNGGYGGLLKQNIGSHEGTVGAWSDGDCLPVLLEILCSKHLSQELLGSCMLHPLALCAPLRDIAFTSVLSVTLCALLYKHFSLRKNHK